MALPAPPLLTTPKDDSAIWPSPARIDVESYEIFMFDRRVWYGARGRCWTTTQIRCTSANGKRALLVFYDPDRTRNVPKSIQGIVFIPDAHYRRIVEQLRLEEPLTLSNDDTRWWYRRFPAGTKAPTGGGDPAR